MNSLVIFSFLIAASLAQPFDIAEVFLTEDTAGNYKFSLTSKAISREEQRSQDGTVVGKYAFVDPSGAPHKIDYVAGANRGYVASGADIPVPVPESPELIQARNNHFAALAEEQAKFPAGVPQEKPVPLAVVLSQLVLPEIASLPAEAVPAESVESYRAKAELLAEYAKILTNLAEEYKRAHV